MRECVSRAEADRTPRNQRATNERPVLPGESAELRRCRRPSIAAFDFIVIPSAVRFRPTLPASPSTGPIYIFFFIKMFPVRRGGKVPLLHSA